MKMNYYNDPEFTMESISFLKNLSFKIFNKLKGSTFERFRSYFWEFTSSFLTNKA